MKIKVCGMKYPGNIKELTALPIDMLGMIFYEKSPRYAGGLNAGELDNIPPAIRKVGVFVNESLENMLEIIDRYHLQMVQLHGNESPALCEKIKLRGVEVIKAFPVKETGDLKKCSIYENRCDYFLFDTPSSRYGGSGKKFDWQILSSCKSQTPFFLSGGIDSSDIESIRQLPVSQLYAIDLNSRFEFSPGLKNINKLKEFISGLNF
jgi:phosphoribosylanthranilate isomerase